MSALQEHKELLKAVRERQRQRETVKEAQEAVGRAWDRYLSDEETVRNDYSEWFQGGLGDWPGQAILGADEAEICEEFPALKRLLALKAELTMSCAIPSTTTSPVEDAEASSIEIVLRSIKLVSSKFDVILIAPPLSSSAWSWENTFELPIRHLSSDPSFVFLWVGSSNNGGLERGRECLAKWGFRRCEDLIFIKRNRHIFEGHEGGAEASLFTTQKEHCLMGIRGTVRRATDSWFVHCNVDVDTQVWDNPRRGPHIPLYLYTLIENFCLGWTFYKSPRDSEAFADPCASSRTPPLIPFHQEIDTLRPKSPPSRRSAVDELGRMAPKPMRKPVFREAGAHVPGSNGPTYPFQSQAAFLRPHMPNLSYWAATTSRQYDGVPPHWVASEAFPHAPNV